jgi:hypothetical protein
MGAYTAFLDLALGLGSPALGLIAKGVDLDAVFLASSLTVLASAAVAFGLLRAGRCGEARLQERAALEGTC